MIVFHATLVGTKLHQRKGWKITSRQNIPIRNLFASFSWKADVQGKHAPTNMRSR